jgi:hypothetical protein
MKNDQLKRFTYVCPPKRNCHVPVFSFSKDWNFIHILKGPIREYGYKWTLSYGTNSEDELIIECVCLKKKDRSSLQEQDRKDIALDLRNAKSHLKREWHKRNPSPKTMNMFKVEALTPDGWSDDASLLGFGTSQDDNRWPSQDAALAACVEMCDVLDPTRLRVVPVDG